MKRPAKNDKKKLLYTKYPQYQHIDIGKLSIVIYPQKTIFWSMLSRENK